MTRTALGVAVLAALVSGCSHAVAGTALPALSTVEKGEFADVAGQWIGHYECAQGVTGLTLNIEAGGRTEFEFYPLATNPAVPSGSFEMQAAISATGALGFTQSRWIDRPGGYLMVDLAVTEQTSTVMRGAVVGTGCTTFDVTRDRT